jgi:hypothetical protein
MGHEACREAMDSRLEEERVVRVPSRRRNEKLQCRSLQFAVMRVEQCQTAKLSINRIFEEGFAEKYLQEIGLTLDGDPVALVRGRHPDAPDRRNIRTWRRVPRLLAGVHAVSQVDRYPYGIGCVNVECSTAVTPSRDHYAGRRLFPDRMHERWGTDRSDCLGDWCHSPCPSDG